MKLTKDQLSQLRHLAHGTEPVVLVGKSGVSEELISEVSTALRAHELIKIKFVGHKEEKKELGDEIALRSESILVARPGNCIVLYKQHKSPDKRKIKL